jgi:pimeloyl-ACP methyl ester carboxylesterase
MLKWNPQAAKDKEKKDKAPKKKPALVFIYGGFRTENRNAPAPFNQAVIKNPIPKGSPAGPEPDGRSDSTSGPLTMGLNFASEYGDAIDVYIVAPILTPAERAQLLSDLSSASYVMMTGYSLGGVLALNLAAELFSVDVVLDAVILVDPALNASCGLPFGPHTFPARRDARLAAETAGTALLITGAPGVLGAYGWSLPGFDVERLNNIDHMRIDDYTYKPVKEIMQFILKSRLQQ